MPTLTPTALTPTAATSNYTFGLRSQGNLVGVHQDLVAVAYWALARSPVDFMITNGVRSPAQQAELVRTGASKTLRSRHITGHALDVAALVEGKVTWDWAAYVLISVAFKAAALELNIPIEWGGDWKSFKDGPHFQLPYLQYPVTASNQGVST